MTPRRMYDAAYPPAHPPAWEIAAGYIGGDTPHVWTTAEWASQPARWRLPIWTRSNPAAVNPETDARTCLTALRTLSVPPGATVALDLETVVAPAWTAAFHGAVRSGGYTVMAYGSSSTVGQNTADLYWLAHWTGQPHMVTGSRVGATQYASASMLGTDYDASLVADTLTLWDTHASEADMALTDADAAVIWNHALTHIGSTGQPDGTREAGTILGWLDYVHGSIEAALAKLGTPQVDAAQLATALASNAAFVEAIAAAVVAKAGTDLSKS